MSSIHKFLCASILGSAFVAAGLPQSASAVSGRRPERFGALQQAPDQAGSVNTTGQYNHFSARSYEDLLHITKGGDDGMGHLGYAAQPGLMGATLGTDVFNRLD